jgi:hypothetical protein
MHKTTASVDGDVQSNVDELYRLELGFQNPRTFTRDTTTDASGNPRGLDESKGWESDSRRGVARLSAFGAAGGKRNAFVRIPEKRAAIIILTNDATADVKVIADQITDRLLFSKKAK